MNPHTVSALAAKTLDEHKAIDIRSIDVTSLTNVTDYIVICTATSTRHAQSLVERVKRKLREEGIHSIGMEGMEQNDPWILVDFGTVVVHVLLEQAREFYNLEKLWSMTQEIRDKAVGED